jgi:hypothetical protein
MARRLAAGLWPVLEKPRPQGKLAAMDLSLRLTVSWSQTSAIRSRALASAAE